VSFERLTSVVRVISFYFTALMLMLVVGGILQVELGLVGIPIYQVLIYLLLPILFVRTVERKPIKPFLRLNMLTFKGVAKAVLLGVTCWFMVQQLSTALILLLHQFDGEMIQPYDFLMDAPVWLLAIVGMLIPAIVEEVSFRGYVLGALRPLGPVAAVVATGLLFGMLHMSLVRLIPLSLLGMVWAYVVQRTNSILPGMIMHFVNNGIALGLTVLLSNQVNAADLSVTESIPALGMWLMIGLYGSMAVGAGIGAFFLARSFSPADLAHPAEALAAEEALQQKPDTELLLEQAVELPPEYRAMSQELALLRERRRRWLVTGGVLAGLGTLLVYGFAVYQELSVVFG